MAWADRESANVHARRVLENVKVDLIGRGRGDVGAWEASEQAGLKGRACQPCRHILATSLHHSTVHACHSRPAGHTKTLSGAWSLLGLNLGELAAVLASTAAN